jgi:glycosyltransferase involved in cell wall biosynthesis
MRGELEGLARSLGLGKTVTFVGAAARADVPGYFAAADVVSVPTVQHEDGYVEGFGYVVLEAGATGTPVIASRVGGLPEAVLDGDTGILVPERDPAALADAIVTLAEDNALRERLGSGAHARALAAPSWETVARQWMEIYERAIASHSSGARP